MVSSRQALAPLPCGFGFGLINGGNNHNASLPRAWKGSAAICPRGLRPIGE